MAGKKGFDCAAMDSDVAARAEIEFRPASREQEAVDQFHWVRVDR
ncbi:hypothetical protein [Nocardia sp. NBC_01009]|nr:hypothetical protein OHA42_04045 [Nocardia sp. NBC_01009]